MEIPKKEKGVFRDAIDAHMYQWAQKYRRIPTSEGGTSVQIWWPSVGTYIGTHDWMDGIEMSEYDIIQLARHFYELGKNKGLEEK